VFVKIHGFELILKYDRKVPYLVSLPLSDIYIPFPDTFCLSCDFCLLYCPRAYARDSPFYTYIIPLTNHSQSLPPRRLRVSVTYTIFLSLHTYIITLAYSTYNRSVLCQ
jgi:hypothetical protein